MHSINQYQVRNEAFMIFGEIAGAVRAETEGTSFTPT